MRLDAVINGCEVMCLTRDACWEHEGEDEAARGVNGNGRTSSRGVAGG